MEILALLMMLHDVCTSRNSQVLTLASLQRLKMESLIPAPTNCEVRSVIKFLNAQSIAPIEIRQLCQQLFSTDFPPLVAQNCHREPGHVPDGCQSNWHQNAKQSAWNQH